MAYGIGIGLERATGTLASTGMGLLQMKQQQEHQRALEANQSALRQIAEDRWKMDKNRGEYEQRQREIAETPYDVADHLPKLSRFPTVQKALLERAERMGLIENIAGRKIIRKGSLPIYEKEVRSDLPFQLQTDQTALDAIDAELKQLGAELLKKPGDEKLLQAEKALMQEKQGYLSKTVALRAQMKMIDTNLTADEIRAMPDTDPRKINYLQALEREESIKAKYKPGKEARAITRSEYLAGEGTEGQRRKFIEGEVEIQKRGGAGQKDTTYDKQRASAIKSLQEEKIAKPTEMQIAKRQKEMYGAENALAALIAVLAGGSASNPLGLGR